jgi:hypothetical protein
MPEDRYVKKIDEALAAAGVPRSRGRIVDLTNHV